jgi:DGQHR domain-containing protein
MMTNCSFIQIPTRGTEIEFRGVKGEIDNVFLHENLVFIVEDVTLKKEQDIKDHLRKKAEFFEVLRRNKEEFVDFLDKTFLKFKNTRDHSYDPTQMRFRFIYFSLYPFDRSIQSKYTGMVLIDNPGLQYFHFLSKVIKRSGRFDLFKFLGLELGDIGHQSSSKDKKTYRGLLLPESPSGFPHGHKIVSFLVEPNRLLEQGYVLRRESWRTSPFLYQRLLTPNKISEMREFLAKKGRVYVNNVIVSLPSDTELRNDDGSTLSDDGTEQIRNILIEIPRELNTIGIIDGQHRIYSYHEGEDKLDTVIAKLRIKQHLLLTGIVYPKGFVESNRIKFEAELFLEINNKQKKVKPALRQEIETMIRPFSTISISKQIVNALSVKGPLSGYFERYFFEEGRKIKTSSIVSYGMKYIVKPSGVDSLYSTWSNPRKKRLLKKDAAVLQKYVDYCVGEINMFINGFKMNVPSELWDVNRKRSRVLTTTTINGLISCLRELIEKGKTGDFDYYKRCFSKLNTDNFKPENFKYKSSHWKALGTDLYDQCFR